MIEEKDLVNAHKYSSYHRHLMTFSEDCVCFYCRERFKTNEIDEWIDGAQTALCPRCGIDSVLTCACPYELNDHFIEEMSLYWFSFDLGDEDEKVG